MDFFSQDSNIFQFVVLPALIFIARVIDVSINTVRIIFMLQSKKWLSTVLGFFESLIWLLAISQIFQNLTSWPTYLAYSGGFATGIFVGMVIEEKLAIGRVVVRIITSIKAKELEAYLEANDYRFSSVPTIANGGPASIIFTVMKRERLPKVIEVIKGFNPNAFYTVEGVKRVSDDDIMDDRGFLWRKRKMFRREQ